MLETNRLLLRQWQESDFMPFAKLNADVEVRRYFPDVQTQENSIRDAKTCQSLIAEKGWGFWAVELKSTNEFIGFIGLHEPSADLPFSPCVEIGWRLSKQFWGHGYATEGAKEVLSYAFKVLNLDEVVSFTVLENTPSRAVMSRIGLSQCLENFNHPDIALDHPLSEHVLYKITKREWFSQKCL